MIADVDTTLAESLGSDRFLSDPYPVYRRLRAEAPVWWSELWGCWVVTRYDDVKALLLDPRRASNVGRQATLVNRLPAEQRERLRSLAAHYSAGGLSNQDPPAHTRLRGLVSQAFTPRVVANLRPRIERIVDGLLDCAAAADQVDVIREFAYPLPAIVIAELLGLPAEDRARFKGWSDEITALLGAGRADPVLAERGQRGLNELRAYIAALLADRRRVPEDDLLSGLVAAEERGDVLSEGEMVGSCVTILLGGHETTTNLIGNGLLTLLRHPGERERLRRDPALMPVAVEEFLRYDAPVQRLWRVLKEDVELGGRRLRAGEAVFLMVGAANRDPVHFAEPDRLDVGRRPNRHLTFGHGIHFCPGASLARLEAEIAFAALLRRFPAVRLADGELEYHPNVAFRGLVSLTVVLTPGEGGVPMRR
jgi:cytochrome P450